MYIVQSMYYNTCHMYAFKQWRATLGQRSHATQTNACKSVEQGHARARPRKCYTLSELEQLAEYNAVYMYTVDVHYRAKVFAHPLHNFQLSISL